VEYIIGHSGAKLILVDYEYAHLVPASFSQQNGLMKHSCGAVEYSVASKDGLVFLRTPTRMLLAA
jgi:hypothetical protein